MSCQTIVAFLWVVGQDDNTQHTTQPTVKLPLRHVNNQRALTLDDVDLIARVKPSAYRDIISNHHTMYMLPLACGAMTRPTTS